MRRSRNLPLPAGRLDYIIFVSGIKHIPARPNLELIIYFSNFVGVLRNWFIFVT